MAETWRSGSPPSGARALWALFLGWSLAAACATSTSESDLPQGGGDEPSVGDDTSSPDDDGEDSTEGADDDAAEDTAVSGDDDDDVVVSDDDVGPPDPSGGIYDIDLNPEREADACLGSSDVTAEEWGLVQASRNFMIAQGYTTDYIDMHYCPTAVRYAYTPATERIRHYGYARVNYKATFLPTSRRGNTPSLCLSTIRSALC
jgi:hypothetical protein